MVCPLSVSQASEGNRILNVIKKMEAAFQEIDDYTCVVEQIFYQGGIENQRYLFKYYFKKKKMIRVDFSYPYPTLSLFYNGGDSEVTALPLRSISFFKFHLSIDNPRIRTTAGQKINQTDMGYFIEFLSENLKKVSQTEEDFEEDGTQVRFRLQASDYIRGRNIERYRISISKEAWLPVRIERHTLEGELLELILIKNYTINTHLEDKLFNP
jgi:outer membrane lipoprotein-sorting protein